MAHPRWKITGYDGAEQCFEHWLPFDALKEPEIEELLARLASQHLSAAEVLRSSLKHGAKDRLNYLDVIRMPDAEAGLMTTGNPYYTATVEET